MFRATIKGLNHYARGKKRNRGWKGSLENSSLDYNSAYPARKGKRGRLAWM